ncbi:MULTISPECIES: DUF1206 domain-containing protein [unclassified Aureimonas]|uniref:DUF1206 domain-containing protein n=1 Tax=unclassified Aureimonas TaxID=2615206 RepID=UPI0006FC4087|nr:MULTISPECIES: DUF1206 domain-containing protein [unclassified Aureimonas]KQT52873.1 hypothetical protein ASG62_13225 [Aureimonas sp. Leaf427]KQT80332.1 hypothetical protein ASG54_07075 [Aureimonas sp. Leaf460]
MSATEVIRRHSDRIEKAARAGYVARGIVFVIIGYFAFKAAYSTGQTMDSKDAVSFVFGTVGGKVLLVALVAALAAFAAWRFLQAIRDVDRHGTGAKGVAVRAGLVGSGISYAALAFFAGALAWGAGSSSSGGTTKEWIAMAYEAGWGQTFTYAVAALMVVVGGAHVFKAVSAGFEKYMTIPADKKAWVKPVCQFGLLARGFTYLLLAWLLGTGAASYRDGHTPGLETALDAMSAWPFGWLFLAATGIGLIAFGGYAFTEARYRRIQLG